MRTLSLLFLSLCLASSIYASGPFTLSGIERAHVFVKNESELLGKQDLEVIRKRLLALMSTLGITPEQRDAPVLMLKVESISSETQHYIYVTLAIGEDIITKRKEGVKTFAMTYDASDFIESEAPKQDVLESVDFLIGEFVEHFKEDNE